MIEVVEVSACPETRIASRLKGLIAEEWPELATHAIDRVTLVTGLRITRELDILVVIDCARPRTSTAVRRRDGAAAPILSVACAAFVVEVKELDVTKLEIVGTTVVPRYGNVKSTRSVDTQLADCCQAIVDHCSRYSMARPYVGGLVWLTEMPQRELAAVNPWIVGAEATWAQMLDAIAQKGPALVEEPTPSMRSAMGTIRETLTRRRDVTPRDRAKVDALTHDAIVDDLLADLVPHLGVRQLRLTGRGGSGKTTTLALLAKRLAEVDEARVLVLTFHRALRGDIAHLLDTLVPSGVRARIAVETVSAFFLSAFAQSGVDVPMNSDGKILFSAMPEALREFTPHLLRDDPNGFAEYLRSVAPERFAWDYVFVDEAQDWDDAERDALRAFYGAENIVVADGLEQLVRRQTPCDWSVGLAKAQRRTKHLEQSLRMTNNVARFANAVAKASGFVDWRIRPFEPLVGGRVVIARGGESSVVDLVGSIRGAMAITRASPLDALFCVAPSDVIRDDGPRRSRRATELLAAGSLVWDAIDDRTRDALPTDREAWRVVQYDSCRGLEGWITVLFDLDQFVAQKMKYPNLLPGEHDTPEHVARRWLMIAMTRAVSTLVITLRDPDGPVAAMLAEAAASLPRDVVEWTTGPELAAVIHRAS